MNNTFIVRYYTINKIDCYLTGDRIRKLCNHSLHIFYESFTLIYQL